MPPVRHRHAPRDQGGSARCSQALAARTEASDSPLCANYQPGAMTLGCGSSPAEPIGQLAPQVPESGPFDLPQRVVRGRNRDVRFDAWLLGSGLAQNHSKRSVRWLSSHVRKTMVIPTVKSGSYRPMPAVQTADEAYRKLHDRVPPSNYVATSLSNYVLTSVDS
jgi:hypothetical protein